MSEPGAKLIAIIDDNEAVQDSLRDLIESAGFEAQCFGSAKSFLDFDSHREVAGLIIDIRMPNMSGLELQARLKKEERHVPTIFITAFADEVSQTQAMRDGAVGFLVKPFDHRVLLKILRAAIR
jgi:two-component system response regulator FixJ